VALVVFYRAPVWLVIRLVSERANVGVAVLVERARDDSTRALVAEKMTLMIQTPARIRKEVVG
jgi:hypothetical protein